MNRYEIYQKMESMSLDELREWYAAVRDNCEQLAVEFGRQKGLRNMLNIEIYSRVDAANRLEKAKRIEGVGEGDEVGYEGAR